MADNGAGKLINFENYFGGDEVLKTAARSVRSLKKDINDLSKTAADDSGRIAAGFASIKQSIKDIEGKATKLNLFSGEDKAILAALGQQLGELKKRQEEYRATQAAQITIQRGLTDATKQATTELGKQKQALLEAQKAGDVEAQRKAAAAIRETTLANTQLSKALRGANSELTAAKGSYDALVLENNKLTASLRAMAGGLNASSDEAIKLQLQIDKNNATLREFDQQLGLGYRNVGRYAESFESVVKELARARVAQAGLSEGSAAYIQQQQRIIGFQTAAQKAAAQAGLSYDQATAAIEQQVTAITPLAQALNRLEKEQIEVAQSAGAESEAYRKIGFQIQATKKEIDDVSAATASAGKNQNAFAQQLGFSKEGLTQYATQLAVGLIGLQALASGVQAVFQANVEYSRNLAEVRKTTGLTADEAERLADSLKELDTPTNLAGLLKIASVGGQLGIAKDDLLGFTKAIDTAVQALGNDFAGGAEEIATTLGKIGEVYRKELGADTAQNILAVGSAVNELGAVGSATSPFLAEVALRVGAVASQSGIGLKNVLAYAAVLQETGTTAEVAGSSLNRLFSTLSTRTEESFRIAQRANPSLTLKEFTKLVNTDFNQAIQLFLKGLNAGNASTTEQAKLLATLKLQSGEAKSAIVTLAANTDLFAERQKTANDQLRDATSLAKEAAVNVETLGGSFDQLKNEAGEIVTGGFLSSILKFFVDMERLNLKLLAAPFREIGNGIAYLGEKFGLIDKPLGNYTTSIVDNTLAARKQVAAQQELLKSYQSLEGTTGRSAAQELELAKTRGELLKQFGSTDAAAIQASIDKRKAAAESNIQFFKNDIAQYDELIAKTQAKAAAAQNTLNTAPRNSEGVLSSRAGQDAAQALLVAEKELTEQQRQRAQAVAALAKLEGQHTQAKKDGAEAAEEEAAAELQLGRAAKSASARRKAALDEELAANQRRIDALLKFKAEQDKLFSDGQISPEVYKAAVTGLQDDVIQLERNGAAIRIRIAREETTGKLAEIERERQRSLDKKKITEREIADINRNAANEAGLARDEEKRKIAQFRRDIQAKETSIEPLEFRLAGLDPQQLKKADDEIDNFLANQEKKFQYARSQVLNAADYEQTILVEQLANREITQAEFDKKSRKLRKKTNDDLLALDKQYHKETKEDREKAAQDALDDERDKANKRLKLAQYVEEQIGNVGGYYFQLRQQRLDAETASQEKAKADELNAAGSNEKLKNQITEKYAKLEADRRKKQAALDKQAALFDIALNTAKAVTSVLSTGGGTYYADFGISATVLAAIVVAQGLAQAALVLAKPTPYFKGRQDGPAELALVGERGPELIERAGKAGADRFEYAATQGLVYLNAHDKVHTAQATSEMLAQASLTHKQAQQPARLAADFGNAAQGAAAAREAAGRGAYDKLAENLAANTRALKQIQAPKITVHRGSDADVEIRRNLTHYLSQRRFK